MLNADISLDRPQTSILKNSKTRTNLNEEPAKSNPQVEETKTEEQQPPAQPPQDPQYLRIKEETIDTMGQEFDQHFASSSQTSTTHNMFYPKANEEEEVIANEKKIVIDRLYKQAQTEMRPKNLWYLAASDEQYTDLDSEVHHMSAQRFFQPPIDNSMGTFIDEPAVYMPSGRFSHPQPMMAQTLHPGMHKSR